MPLADVNLADLDNFTDGTTPWRMFHTLRHQEPVHWMRPQHPRGTVRHRRRRQRSEQPVPARGQPQPTAYLAADRPPDGDRTQPARQSVLERRSRSDGTCSINLRREQFFQSQKYRRTHRRTTTRRGPNGVITGPYGLGSGRAAEPG
ncbi:hypothetical protein AQJ58_04115 [Streptomyces sp. DSM 15324]|nr:hypothetical protein AQJ58_04115 [Streptomyces sp. DSM 15324]